MPSNSIPRRFRLLAVLALFSGLTGCFGTGDGPERVPGTPPDSEGGEEMVLVFADEFDEGTMPNPEKWNIETGYGPNDSGWGNDEWQLYTDSPDNVRVEGGNLVIQARCDVPPCGERDDTVTSARLNTSGKFDFRYGRIEARIQAPTGKAAWPAFWALGANFPGTPWPRAGEIDFMELFDNGSDPNTTHFTMHWCAAQPDSCDFPNGYATQTQSLTTSEDLGDDFHIYSAEWNANQVIGKIDGITYFVANIDPNTMEEFRRRFFMILNVAMGGTLGSGTQPPAGDEVWPQTMLVDWVRVYQREADIGSGDGGIIDFEEGGEPYSFINFEGGVGTVVDNPIDSDFNTSPRVARYQKFRADSGATFGGSRLEIGVDLPPNSSYRMKVYATREVNVLFKLEETTTGEGGVERTVTHGGTGWEELTFDFTAAPGSYPGGLTFIFDVDTLGDAAVNAADWTFYVDDIEQVTADGPAEERTSFDFEADGEPYIFEEFEGGVAFVEDNPQIDATNPSARVVEMRKTVGATFAGSTLVAPMMVPAGNAYTMKVLSRRAVPLLLKLEDGVEPPTELEVMHSGNGWEELRFEFPAYSGSIRGLTFIFDNGVVGDFGRDMLNWTFYIDDVELVPSDPNAGLDQIDLPITFDDPATNYTVADFNGAVTTIVADPDDPINRAASTMKPTGAFDTAGTTMSTATGLASAIPFTATDTTIGVRVRSPRAGIPVRLKAEVLGNASSFVEVDVLTTAAGAWETLVFDFASPAAGSPLLDPSADYRLLSIFFDFGAVGTGDTYLWDDVEFGVQPPPPVDETPPMLTSVSIGSSNPMPTLARAGDMVMVTFVANEALATPTVMIAGAPGIISGAGANWVASRMLSDTDSNGVISIEIAYADLAGNSGMVVTSTNDGSSVTLDTMAPAVSIEDAPLDFTSLRPIVLRFQFTEAVTGFTTSDIVVTNGTKSGFTAANDGATYTASVRPTGSGDLTVSVAAGVAMDAAGNPNTAAMAVTVSNALEGIPLDVVTVFSNNTTNPAFARTGDVVTVEMTALADIDEPTVTIAGVVATVSGGPRNWLANRTMQDSDDEGEIEFEIEFQYADGSPGEPAFGSNDNSVVTLDRTPPEPMIEFLMIGSPPTINPMETVVASFEFGEEVTGFDIMDITVVNGSAAALDPSDTVAADYEAEITADGNGDVTVSVAAGAVTDQAGNDNEAASVTATLNVSPTYQLLWSDEFSGSSLNADNWTARTDSDCPDPCPGEQEYLTERVSVAAGFLNIEARNMARGGGSFTSGLVDTLGNNRPPLRYGKIEIDARMPGTQGTLPSFWLLPISNEYGPWPQSGQIDIVNAPEIGAVAMDKLNFATRYGLPEPEDTTTDFDDPPMLPPDGAVNTYAIEWNANEIRWYVNGDNVVSQSAANWYAYFENEDGILGEGSGGAPFDEEFYLLMGLAMGSNAGSGTYPQTLSIDEVRVFECANPDDPALGTGCITGTAENVLSAASGPYTETVEVYTDAPATLDFFDPQNPGTTVSSTLVTGTEASPGATVSSSPATPDGADIVWNLNFAAPAGSGTAFVRAPDNGAQTGFFNLSGGEAAGEVLFRMRVNSADVAAVDISLSDQAGAGSVSVPITPDGVWRNYSVKMGDIVADSVLNPPSLNLATVSDAFSVVVTNGTVNLDLDDISLKVACREASSNCSAQPRLPTETLQYSQDFEALSIGEGFPPNSLSDDGWRVFGNVYTNIGDTVPVASYGTFLAPNGVTNAFCAVEGGEGGVTQGDQQFSVFNDYGNTTAHLAGQYVEALVFQERTIVADDTGKTVRLSFDAKKGLIAPPTIAAAYFKTLDPMAGFATTNFVELDMTSVPETWDRYEIVLDLTDPALEGQLLQFGFSSRTTNFEPSSVFYDNVELTIIARE